MNVWSIIIYDLDDEIRVNQPGAVRGPVPISLRHAGFLHTRGGGTCETFAIEDNYQHPHESIALRIARKRARIGKIDLHRVTSVLRDERLQRIVRTDHAYTDQTAAART